MINRGLMFKALISQNNLVSLIIKSKFTYWARLEQKKTVESFNKNDNFMSSNYELPQVKFILLIT